MRKMLVQRRQPPLIPTHSSASATQPTEILTMCLNYRMGFEEAEPSNNLRDKFLIILTFDPSGMVRVTTLGRPPAAPHYRLEARRSRIERDL
jgi:hypothetical protein